MPDKDHTHQAVADQTELLYSEQLEALDPARRRLAVRLNQILTQLSDEAVSSSIELDDRSLMAALAAPESWIADSDAVHEALQRGAVMRKRMLEEAGGAWTLQDVANYLGLTEGAVRKRINEGTLIGIKGSRGYLIPACQFVDGREIPGLSKVLRAIPTANPWTKLNWLLSRDSRLDGERPIDLLMQGRRNAVEGAAALVGEHGAP